MVSSGGKKDAKVDESQFHRNGQPTSLVTDAPFFDRASPMTPYEWTKTVLLFPLFLVRLILCLIGLLLVWIFMQLLLVGAPTKEPFEPWRENMARGTVRTAGKMMIVASLGALPRVRGWEHVADGEATHAPVIFNHISYVDALILAAYFAPCGVAKAGVADLPLFGCITRGLQFLFVARRGTTDVVNKYTMVGDVREQVAKREVDPRYPRFMLAPEATTKPGHTLLRFSVGAFAPGVPVQPVLLDYSRNKCFNPGWGLDASTYWHFIRFQTQFRTYIDLTVLPLYHPSDEEKKDARLFADNVRKLMAEHLHCSLSDFSTKEEFLLKTGGVRVDWKFRNIVMDRKHGPPMLLETIQPQADDKLKAQ